MARADGSRSRAADGHHLADTSGAPTMMKARAPTVAKMLKGEDTPVTFDLAGCIKDLQSMQAEGESARAHAAAGADDARLHGGSRLRRAWAAKRPRCIRCIGRRKHRRSFMSVTLAQASTIVDTALKKGRETNCAPLTVAVLDAGGHLVAFKREDRSGILRFDIAYGKAWGALGMGFGSRELADRAGKNPMFFGVLATVSQGRLVPVPGGVLIKDAAAQRARRGRDFGRHLGQGRGVRDRRDRGGGAEGGGGGVAVPYPARCPRKRAIRALGRPEVAALSARDERNSAITSHQTAASRPPAAASRTRSASPRRGRSSR